MAIIISFIALAFSVGQFYSERKRNRQEATIHAFDELETDESVLYLFSLSRAQIDDLVEQRKKYDIRIDSDWKIITKALSLIEHFAVGVNSEVYDLDILNRMAGNKIIDVLATAKL